MLVVAEPLQKERDISNSYRQISRKQLWSPRSWENFLAMQQPIYKDSIALEKCLNNLRHVPAMVSLKQVEQLKKHIAQAALGQEFLLQAGDCAEQFNDCSAEIVLNKVQSILKIKRILEHGLHKPVTPIGRIAGQYAKPRSYDTEIQNSLVLPSFKGDIIHSREYSVQARETNPYLMLTAYEKSLQTLNFIKKFQGQTAFYTSHEALLLCYESALTRQIGDIYYNASAHMVWLGERTRSINGAHVEYLRGIQNPIGIKLSHKLTSDELVELVVTLNPEQEDGKIVLIHRLGSEFVDLHLPRIIKTVKKANLNVTWMNDPMHGNGDVTFQGIKTRHLESISYELIQSLKIHRAEKTILAGIHLETAEENVTECLGGKQNIGPEDLNKNYKSACDPRLNPSQCEELTFHFIKEMRNGE